MLFPRASAGGSTEGSAAPGLHVRLAQTQPIPLGVRFAARGREVLALVGPSGSGKSTVLRCIAGLHRAAAGRIVVNGETWFDAAAGVHLAPYRRRTGLVLQSYALFPHMTVLGNVLSALGHLPAPAREARAREVLDIVNLAGLEHRRPAQLSGGQQQRVAVARALAREPDVLLLDEPFSAVDKATREKLYRELAAMRTRLSMPVVLVTHDLDEATLLADRLCILHHGNTLQIGTPAEVVDRPDSAEVARLVGHKNIFKGTVVGHDTERGLTMVRWRDRVHAARGNGSFSAGAAVAWLVPPAHILLHRRGRPSRGEAENPVSGVLSECTEMRDTVICVLRIGSGGGGGDSLTFAVPSHVARRNGLAIGEETTVSLLAAGIHLMPPE